MAKLRNIGGIREIVLVENETISTILNRHNVHVYS